MLIQIELDFKVTFSGSIRDKETNKFTLFNIYQLIKSSLKPNNYKETIINKTSMKK